MERRLPILLEQLGYRPVAGWVPASEFDSLPTHRFALEQASREMSVLGAFCLKNGVGVRGLVVTPLVYVAATETIAAAQEIHRRVWSQGLAPFLLVLTPDGVGRCPGFSYTHRNWERLVHWFGWESIEALPSDPFLPTHSAGEIWDLRASRLRTSLFWRDHSIDVGGRVDRRLLDSLDALSAVLIRNPAGSKPLSPAAANGLIGRFLYLYFLAARGIIDKQWLLSRKHREIDLDEPGPAWSTQHTWAFFDDLDAIFNDSIFPLGAAARAEIDAGHINLVRLVMKHGAQPLPTGDVQLSFIDFHLGALRTETLASVYEQFLENIRAGERRRDGAFYTPPFLVDFMLDRIEDILPLEDGVTLLDPSAGSGVFLVGAYRRLIERSRIGQLESGLDLDQLRGLLLRNVFGVERNVDACHVTAFSLYLTMLDYVDRRALTRVTACAKTGGVFPRLIGRNLHAADFFSEHGHFPGLPERVRCIVGNPPWQALEKLESTEAEDWRRKHDAQVPVGKNQAAELFTWKALREHLDTKGVLGFLLPAKSFVNPTSWSFRRQLAEEFTVVGAANFAHLRYRLFASARQAVVAAFIRNEPPSSHDRTWVYSPLSVGQPIARKEWPWTIVLDRADVQFFQHNDIARDPRGWFEAFMLRPVDRQIKRYLDDSANEGRVSTVGLLCHSIGAAIRRGGNAGESGIDRRFLVDAPDGPSSGADMLDEQHGESLAVIPTQGDVLLPPKQLSSVKPSYRNRFGGNVLLVPRNFSNIRFVAHPMGYTSSTLAVYFNKPARSVTPREKQLLLAIGAYLRTPVAMYLAATIGRRWLMDRRNIEPADFAVIPIPLTRLDDPRADVLLAKQGAELERFALDSLGLSADMQRAVQEFLDFRIKFQDGDVPKEALERPSPDMITEYANGLERNLNGLMGREDAFRVATQIDARAGVGAVAAHIRQTQGASKGDLISTLCQTALDVYEKSSANSFSDSLSATSDERRCSVTFVKPLEVFRWTIESAYSDSRQIMNTFSCVKVQT